LQHSLSLEQPSQSRESILFSPLQHIQARD